MKILLFSDLHLGAKSNSQVFNDYCVKFVKFLTNYVKTTPVDQIFFLGDWHDTRDEIHSTTLNYSHQCLNILNDVNIPVKMIIGNHDLYYKNSRKIHSIPFSKTFQNIKVINDPLYDEQNCLLFVPWMVGDENLITLIQQYQPKFVFCHAELPGFAFNKFSTALGTFEESLYAGPNKIISGHYHQRQHKSNVVYIGNCFCSTFADLNEEHNRGFAILDTNTAQIEYVEVPDMPVYRKINLSEVNQSNTVLDETNLYLKIIVDKEINNEDLIQLRTDLLNKDNIISVSFENIVTDNIQIQEENVQQYETVEDLVLHSIDALEIDNYDKPLLKQLFKEN